VYKQSLSGELQKSIEGERLIKEKMKKKGQQIQPAVTKKAEPAVAKTGIHAAYELKEETWVEGNIIKKRKYYVKRTDSEKAELRKPEIKVNGNVNSQAPTPDSNAKANVSSHESDSKSEGEVVVASTAEQKLTPTSTGQALTTSLHTPSISHQPIMNTPSLPIRTKPEVIRILVKTWVDRDGVLHGGSYMYVVANEGKWVFGNKEITEVNNIIPLE
jgi:type IV conjugative transfer system lipoprotein TraV